MAHLPAAAASASVHELLRVSEIESIIALTKIGAMNVVLTKE